METRITIYRDPCNEKKWIVAKDNGDPSEETVVAERTHYAAAKKIAKKVSAETGCKIYEEIVKLL